MPPNAEKPSINAFFRSFGGSWLTLMSGPLTIPFTLAAYFVSDALARVLFGALAITCFGLSSYLIWKKERENVVATQADLSGLQTPKLAWEWRKDNTKYLIKDGDRDVSLIYLINRTVAHIEKIEVFCYDGIATPYGDFFLYLNTSIAAPQLRLSQGEPVPVKILAFTAYAREFNCLLPYRASQNERLQGKGFVIKIMIVGTTPAGVSISSPRILARFGIDRDGKCYFTYEES